MLAEKNLHKFSSLRFLCFLLFTLGRFQRDPFFVSPYFTSRRRPFSTAAHARITRRQPDFSDPRTRDRQYVSARLAVNSKRKRYETHVHYSASGSISQRRNRKSVKNSEKSHHPKHPRLTNRPQRIDLLRFGQTDGPRRERKLTRHLPIPSISSSPF